MAKKGMQHLFEWKFINDKNYSTDHFKCYDYFREKPIHSEKKIVEADLNCISYRISEISMKNGLRGFFRDRVTVLVVSSDFFVFPVANLKDSDFQYFKENFANNYFLKLFVEKFPGLRVESIGNSIIIFNRDKLIEPEYYGALLTFARLLVTELTVALRYPN